MRRIIRVLFGFFWAIFGLIDCQSKSSDFESDEYGFSIKMPGRIVSQDAHETRDGQKMISIESRKGINKYEVSCHDMSSLIESADSSVNVEDEKIKEEDWLEYESDTTGLSELLPVPGPGIELIGLRRIIINGYPGVETVLNVKGVLFKERKCAVGMKIYTLTVGGIKAFFPTKQAGDFFNSFKLTE